MYTHHTNKHLLHFPFFFFTFYFIFFLILSYVFLMYSKFHGAFLFTLYMYCIYRITIRSVKIEPNTTCSFHFRFFSPFYLLFLIIHIHDMKKIVEKKHKIFFFCSIYKKLQNISKRNVLSVYLNWHSLKWTLFLSMDFDICVRKIDVCYVHCGISYIYMKALDLNWKSQEKFLFFSVFSFCFILRKKSYI